MHKDLFQGRQKCTKIYVPSGNPDFHGSNFPLTDIKTYKSEKFAELAPDESVVTFQMLISQFFSAECLADRFRKRMSSQLISWSSGQIPELAVT
jgi:hypothetical protein